VVQRSWVRVPSLISEVAGNRHLVRRLYVAVISFANSILVACPRLFQPARRGWSLSRALVVVAVVSGVWPVVAASTDAAAPTGATESAAKLSVIAAPVRSVRTAYGTVGYRSVGHGRPLVLIMGLSGSIDVWPPSLIDALARHHRVIAFDNEGIGLSTLRSGTLTISRMGDDTAAFISALHLRRPDVLGWSMGGFIAQAFAARHPGQYRRLILAATAPGNGHAMLPSASVIKVLTGGGGNILDYLFPPDQAREGPAFIAAITKYPHFYAAPAKITALQLSASARWLSGKDPSGHHDRRLRAPTLIGDGAEDALIPSANSPRLGRLIPHARVKLYPDAGHGFLFQDESSWLRLVERFLSAGERRAG
jgi:pimeloyl-ACP methyl ester carboxylesterase